MAKNEHVAVTDYISGIEINATPEEIEAVQVFSRQLVEDIGRFTRADLIPTHNLKAIFKSIRNHLAANTIGATRDEVLAQQLINIKIKKEIDPYYIVSFLNSEYGQMQLERVSSGSILQSIRSSDLKKIKIILPPIEVQKTIGKKLKDAVYAATQARIKIAEADNEIFNLCK
jgi:hypothetical protein